MSLELDHVFMCVEVAPAAERALSDFGLRFEAAFLPPGKSIPIVTPRNAGHDPLIFLISATLPIRTRLPQEHRGKHRRLTRVTVSGPWVSSVPADVAMLCDRETLTVKQAPEHHLELDWDGASSGEYHDFRPALPLLLRW
jgi:hypothetical protein